MDLEKLLEKFEDDWSREGGRLNDAAFFSLKLLFVLNGGALLALFAFLSALIGSILSSNKLHIVAPLLDQVRDLSLIWLTGLSLALFATLFMYFTFRFNMRILQKSI